MNEAAAADSPFGFGRVAVIGPGLIGGSFAAALRARRLARSVVVVGHGDHAEQAVRLGLADEACASARVAAADADLIVLAAPIPAIAGLLHELAPVLGPQALVTDCASTKAGIVEAARGALGPAFARFVAGHPIAGSERSGPTAARAGLFEGAWVVLTPEADTSAEALQRVESVWTAIGARPIRLSAPVHDRLFAQISHWPHAVAFALCAAVADGDLGEQALTYAGAGLRDTTRIGASSPELWADILLDNRDAVLDAADAFQRQMTALLDALRDGDRSRLVEQFARASRWRQKMAPKT